MITIVRLVGVDRLSANTTLKIAQERTTVVRGKGCGFVRNFLKQLYCRAVDKFLSLGVLTFTIHKQLCAVASIARRRTFSKMSTFRLQNKVFFQRCIIF